MAEGKATTQGRLPKCAHCEERTAVCVGSYEGSEKWTFACDVCCGHGCEDGQCYMLASDGDPLPLDVEQAVEERDAAIAAFETVCQPLVDRGGVRVGAQAMATCYEVELLQLDQAQERVQVLTAGLQKLLAKPYANCVACSVDFYHDGEPVEHEERCWLDALLGAPKAQSPTDRIVALLDEIWGMDSAGAAEDAESQVLVIDESNPGALWAVASSHPHVETRAQAARLVVNRLLSDRPLVAAGVRDAVTEADERQRELSRATSE